MSIVLPESLVTDRAVIALVAQWRNLLQIHAHCLRRRHWSPQRASADRKRRARRWTVDARLRVVERELLQRCADATQHPDLYMAPVPEGDPLDHTTFSRHARLVAKYYAIRKRPGIAHPERNTVARQQTIRKRLLVQQIIALEWKWCSALYQAVFPDTPLPPPRVRDLRTLYPARERAAAERFYGTKTER
jgi:hypothetical protein